MYNEGVKNAFIEKAKAENNTGVLKQKYIFNKTERFEEKLQKDIALFNKNELSDMYKNLDLSLSSFYVMHSFLRKYAKFYSGNFYVLCPILEMSHEEIRNIYNQKEKKPIEKNVFPVRDFFKKIDDLKNPSDKFLMYGLFQGIRGISNCELAFSTMEDCNTESREIWLAGFDNDVVNPKMRLYRADKKLFDYALDASKTYNYITYDEEEQVIPLVSNKIIKVKTESNKGMSETLNAGKIRIDVRLRVLLKHMGLTDYSGLEIYKVGLAYQIKKICLDYGITDLLEVFRTEEYKTVKAQYNLTDNERNVRRLLKGFL